MEKQELIIIGAGAAGLFAGARCSSAGIKTSVFDSMSRPGRKLLVTGQGKCNLTNAAELSDFIKHYGDKQRFVKKCLYGFNCDSLRKLLSSRGLKTICREDGKVFPESERASDVLKCILEMCSKSYIDFNFDSRITEIKHETGTFTAYTDEGPVASAPRLLISSGGFTYPATGSKGDGFRFASSLGHNIITPRPSLAAVSSLEEDFNICAGISLNVRTNLFRGEDRICSRFGALLFTHTGLSGPVIIDNSREIQSGDRIELNLLPDFNAEDLISSFISYCDKHGRSRIKIFFTGLFLPDRLVTAVCSRAGVDAGKNAADITKMERKTLLTSFSGLSFIVKQLDGKKKAMCTAGGVDTSEIKPATMESKLIDNLYFAGEVIDVDGDSGGFNLQFAFSSAYAAVESIIKSR